MFGVKLGKSVYSSCMAENRMEIKLNNCNQQIKISIGESQKKRVRIDTGHEIRIPISASELRFSIPSSHYLYVSKSVKLKPKRKNTVSQHICLRVDYDRVTTDRNDYQCRSLFIRLCIFLFSSRSFGTDPEVIRLLCRADMTKISLSRRA